MESTNNKKRQEEFQGLPEGCIAAILSRTTPFDACRLSLISKTFCSAAESDTVWEHFLPTDSHFISLSPSLPNAPTKKALYLALSGCPIIIDDGKKSFQLDRKSGKKCYMLAARTLTRVFTGQYWNWISMPESRFPEVAELVDLWWLGLHGMINTLALSPNTRYAAYLVFKLIHEYGFQNSTVKLSVGVKGNCTGYASLDLDDEDIHMRSDEWLEIEMGEFFNSDLQDEEIYMSVSLTQKKRFFLEGIEVRPKESIRQLSNIR